MTLVWRPGFSGLTDADAIAYVAAVEAADGQALEFGVGKAINDFVVGCKLDGTWSAIKASCILAGARTLNGALVPLAGTAPTNNNFVAGDYNRKTGLVGNGSSKYLNSNRANNADPQNSQHLAVYDTSLNSSDGARIGALGSLGDTTQHNYIDRFSNFRFSSRGFTATDAATIAAPFLGLTRSASNLWSRRINSITTSGTQVSAATTSTANYFIFNRSGVDFYSSSRLAFYSIGESLDLAKLDARVTDLITAIGAAIP